MRLAELCSKAIDYVSNGKPVIIFNRLKRPMINFKPDWDKKEMTSAWVLEYYESDRALGYTFRSSMLCDPSEPIDGFPMTPPGMISPLADSISRALAQLGQNALKAKTICTCTAPGPAAAEILRLEKLHACYVR